MVWIFLEVGFHCSVCFSGRVCPHGGQCMVAESIAVVDINGRKAPWLKEDTTSVREGVDMLPLHRMRIQKQQLFSGEWMI